MSSKVSSSLNFVDEGVQKLASDSFSSPKMNVRVCLRERLGLSLISFAKPWLRREPFLR